VLLWFSGLGPSARFSLAALMVTAWLIAASAVRRQVVRPLQTLANMLAALREGDFSIRARLRTPDAADPLSLAYHEVNAIEDMLREQRLGAVEAGAILRRVLEEVDVAIFAFDDQEVLRLLNRAGERLLGQTAEQLLGRSAGDLRLDGALVGAHPRTLELAYPGGTGRWELRRGVIRQEGLRLRLLVLSDLSRALREEERQAWKRIIRVLSHEINNSLTPIKSISGSLRSYLSRGSGLPELGEDVVRGLQVIENRAEALGRFMASYARLARLPPPRTRPVGVQALVERVVALETRLSVTVIAGPSVTLDADPDQLEQLMINLVGNAAKAALDAGDGAGVRVHWRTDGQRLHLLVEDDGPGVGDAANLFVPFYTTRPGGSGIGLVLARQIAEAHGGSLALENRTDGRGARAQCILPLERRTGPA